MDPEKPPRPGRPPGVRYLHGVRPNLCAREYAALETLQRKLGAGRAQVLRLALRRFAEEHGIPIEQETQ